MPAVEYHSRQPGRSRSLLYTCVDDALSKAIHDLHDGDTEPLAITWGERPLYDAAAIGRVYAACRAELAADP